MRGNGPSRSDIAAAIGLAVGGAFGMAGSFAPAAEVRQTLWVIDGVALVCAAALLIVRHLRRGDDLVAAGFVVFALGQALVLSSATAALKESAPAFAAGISLWAAALVILGLPNVFPIWGRLAGFAAALIFAATAAQMAWGAMLLPTSAPLPSIGYPLLVISLVGWILRLVLPKASEPTSASDPQRT